MKKSDKITRDRIISLYMDYVLIHNSNPSSVYHFASKNGFEEATFYAYFASFEALEQDLFKNFFDHTYTVLQKSDEYQEYNSRNKLLSFYFTFFEILTANRSYVVYALKSDKHRLKSLKKLSQLKIAFLEFIEHLDLEVKPMKQKAINDFQKKTLKETAWIQLLLTLEFWLKDTSVSFEKTDVFIEKSVNTSMNLLDAQTLNSLMDLGQFLFKERTTIFS